MEGKKKTQQEPWPYKSNPDQKLIINYNKYIYLQLQPIKAERLNLSRTFP
uniref:Uncharacterized protein n=1 Tax=Rhizophora mucronata TaxID=61149 RepID=A0A2P2IZL3_RHIMU